MKALTLTLVFAFALALGSSAPLDALVVNYGVDIGSTTGAYSQASPAYYYGDDTGSTLTKKNRLLEFTIQTPGLFGAAVNGFELFLDAEGISRNEVFNVYLYDGNNPVLIGRAADNSRRGTDIPVLGSAFGSHVDSPYRGDTDNSFFLLVPGSQFADEIQAGALRVLIQQVTGSARFDGVNLQVDDDPPPPPNNTHPTPEPATLLLLGLGLLGLGSLRKKFPSAG